MKKQKNETQVVRSDKLPERAQKNRLYRVFFRISTHFIFSSIIILLIIGNTVVLALDSYPRNLERQRTADLLNEVFTWCFIAEMVIKLIGLGFKDYARDAFNLFDALLVVISIIDMVL